MIECSDAYIWYKKRRLTPRKRFFSVIIILIVFIGVFLYYKHVVGNQILNYCKEYSYSYSAESVNKAVFNSLGNSVKYSELISIEKDGNGDIVLISANSYKINTISREIIDDTRKILEEKLEVGIPIPAFAFTGINVISGYGKNVNFKLMHVSSVTCEFLSRFESVGINQTLHSIYLNIICYINIDMPFNKNESKCITDVLISETILIGKVPEIYFDKSIFG